LIGAGDVGMPIIHHLSEKGHLLTVIESDEEKCREISRHSDAAIFNGSGADLEIWRDVEAEKMDALLALTNDDEINMAACQTAKKEFGIPLVIARAHQPENIEKIREAGADIVICPSQETRRLFLNALESPEFETIYENMVMGFKIVRVTIPLNGSVVGRTIEQLNIPRECRIISIFRGDRLMYPDESLVLKGRDSVMLCGSAEDVEETAEKLRGVEVT
jgi:trk system potassium uptake protein TrkA